MTPPCRPHDAGTSFRRLIAGRFRADTTGVTACRSNRLTTIDTSGAIAPISAPERCSPNAADATAMVLIAPVMTGTDTGRDSHAVTIAASAVAIVATAATGCGDARNPNAAHTLTIAARAFAKTAGSAWMSASRRFSVAIRDLVPRA